MKAMFRLIITVLAAGNLFAQTSWESVYPSIQAIEPLDTLGVDSVSFGDKIHISFLSDSLAWTAYELKSQLLSMTGWSNQDVKANHIPLEQLFDVQSEDTSRRWILIDLWNEESPSALEQFLQESSLPDFGVPPDVRTGSREGYYVGRQKKWDTLSVKLMEGFGS